MSKAQHTPGPWAWFGSASTNELYLATTHSGRRYVMSFDRWGMRSAQPVFQPAKGGGLVRAKDLLQFEVGDRSIIGVEAARKDPSVYRYQVRGIACADARLIAAAPELLEALKAALTEIDQEVEQRETSGNDEYFVELKAIADQARSAIAKATGEA